MEQFVLGIFQEQLSKVLVGFKKEQVNANLLNGKGQIRDVNINCAIINEKLCKVAPFIQIESIRVSKLGFHVTSWTNLKKAPICVDIEDVHVTIIEPLTFADKKDRLSLKQLSWTEYRELMKDKKDHRGSYNLFDRIIDNLQIEIQSVKITFQARGKFKTMREGPWTPPAVHIYLSNLKYCSVDEFGNEANPEDCWRHNKFHGHPRDQTLCVYKKAFIQGTVCFQQAGAEATQPILFLNEAQLEVHFAFHRKFINGAILSIQLDVTLNQMDINIEKASIPVLLHTILGLQYCFTKDRAFEDPLIVLGDGLNDSDANVSSTLTLASITPTGSTGEGDESNDENNDGDDTNQRKAVELFKGEDSESELGEEGSICGSVDNSDFDGEEKNDEDIEAEDVSVDAAASKDKTPQLRKSNDRPVILLPSGVVIHGKLSVSVSIHDCKVRGTYDCSQDGFIHLHAKSLVAEVIWPKVTREKGCYVQMSISFLAIQEMHRQKMTTLVRGGTLQDRFRSPIEIPTIPLPELPHDECFPFFEGRSVRPDPLDLRRSYPVQAIGVKATVTTVDSMVDPEHEEIDVLSEIGINLLEAVAHTESWCRAIRFILHGCGDSFDPRWQSGDWIDSISIEMVRSPTQPLILSNHLHTPQLILHDENRMISSDRFNMTAKFAKITTRIPAAIQSDLRSRDIITRLDELLFVVSSALPRTFLRGKVGSSICVDGVIENTSIDFPNDPSDVCYFLDGAEASSLRQNEPDVCRIVSVFRAQLTTKGLTVKALPIIPIYDAVATQDVLAPLDFTMIFSLEGESASPDPDFIKMLLFHSIEINDLFINCDFDVIAGAVSSVLYQYGVVNDAIEDMKRLCCPKTVPQNSQGNNHESIEHSQTQSSKNMDGRSSIMIQQFERSRRTGGFSAVLSLHVKKICLHLWRQNVALNSRFRASLSGDRDQIDEHPVPLIKLLNVAVQDVEVGFEVSLQAGERRQIVKSCLSQLQIDVCDFAKASSNHLESIHVKKRSAEWDQKLVSELSEGGESVVDERHEKFTLSSNVTDNESDHDTVSLVRIGSESGKDILIRIENYFAEGTSVSIAIDLDVGGVVNLHVHEIELLFLLAIEALLLPANLKPVEGVVDHIGVIQFPVGTIGYLLVHGFRFIKKDDTLTLSQINVGAIVEESDSIDQFMNAVIHSMLPQDVSELFLRFTVGDLLVFVPHHGSENKATGGDAPWLGHLIREASLLTGYIESHRTVGSLTKILGQKGNTWSSLFPDQHRGFHHKFNSSQALYCAECVGADVVLKKPLVDRFDLSLVYSPQNIDLSMGDSTLSIEDLRNIRQLSSSMVAFVDRVKLMQHRIQSVINALTRKFDEGQQKSSANERQAFVPDNTTSEVVVYPETSLQMGRCSLERLIGLFDAYDADMRAKLSKQDNEIDRLRVQVFLKERNHIAALALVSCQAAGWIRVGGAHMTGERSQSVTSMWRYHGVLRKSLVLLYAGPSKPRPLDVINLQGASLHTLAGGRRRRDVKNGFAIRERSGYVRYVLATNGRDLDMWLQELQKAVKVYAGDEFIEDDDINADTEQVGNEIGAILRTRSMSSEAGSLEEWSSHSVKGRPKRTQIIKERISKATAVTRTSIGTAIQAAKQRGQKGSNKNESEYDSVDVLLPNAESFQSVEELDVSSNSQDQVPTSVSTESLLSLNENEANKVGTAVLPHEEVSISVADSRNQRFGNLRTKTMKLSSALQGAREKALAVVEERRRRQQERDVTDDDVRRGRRDRIGNAAGNVMLTTEDVDVSSFVDAERILSSTKQGPLNSEATGDLAFDTNSVALASELSVDSVHVATEVVTAMEEGQTPISGSVHRPRFSNFGAVVRNVTQGSQSTKGSVSIEGEIESIKPTRFSLKRNQRQGEAPEESDLLKLKSIRIGGDIKPNQGTGEATIPSLTKIKGCWVVRVQSRDSTSSRNHESSPEEGCGECKIESKLTADEGKNLVQASVVISEASGFVPKYYISESLTNQQEERYHFIIRVFSQDPGAQKTIKVLTINRALQDVIGLFIDVLECVHEIPEEAPSNSVDDGRDAAIDMNDYLARNLGISPIDIVKLTADLLGGLLSASSSFHMISSYHDYLCEVLTAFLNATLQSPLPISGCMAVLEFLDIVEAGVIPVDLTGEMISTPLSTSSVPCELLQEPIVNTSEIRALTASCLTHLHRAETSGILAQTGGYQKGKELKKTTGAKIRRSSSMPLILPFLDPVLPLSITERLRDATHDALKSVMTERDEAQATLIASSVLHGHEIERERKHGDLAKRKLQVAQAEVSRLQQGNFFADKFKDPRAQRLKEVENQLEEMVKRSDEEIESLSKQLASEIADKTAAKLEIYRLQDYMNLARDAELAEKHALVDELRKTREQLARVQEKARACEIETKQLKEILETREPDRT